MDWKDEEYQRQLEAEIDRELRSLPELRAPLTLERRVRAALQDRVALPWYKQSWEMWPKPLRVGTLAFLLGCFAMVCLASWQLTRAAGFSNAMQEVGETFSGVTALWNAFTAVVYAILLVIKHLGTPVIVALCIFAAAGYAACLGLGTMFYRMAFARRS